MKVKLLRSTNDFVAAQDKSTSPEVKFISSIWTKRASFRISPSVSSNTGKLNTGLTYEEIKRLLPEMVGVDPTDKTFRQAVDNYYKEMSIEVPALGKDFNVGLDEEGWPLNLKDYLEYKAIKASTSICAPSQEELDRNRHLVYFESQAIEESKIDRAIDEQLMVSDLFKTLKEEDYKVYLMFDPKGGIYDTANMSASQLKKACFSFATSNPQLFKRLKDDYGTINNPGTTRIKYWLQMAAQKGLLDRSGTAFLYENVKIGGSLDEAVKYWIATPSFSAKMLAVLEPTLKAAKGKAADEETEDKPTTKSK